MEKTMMGTEAGLTTLQGKALTLGEVAKLLHVSTSWLRKQIRAGILPFRYIALSPRKRIFDSADIDNWLKGQSNAKT
jgi:predicted DNA-binding transcriptional regulator AlpA